MRFSLFFLYPCALLLETVAAATTLPAARQVHDIRHRQTQEGDFDRFNELFQGASINISNDFEITERVALIQFTLYVDNIRCYDVLVGDIVLDHSLSNNVNMDVTVNIAALDMNCDINYRYKYGILHGTGVAQVFTDNNSASTLLRFTSEDYSKNPPSSSSVQECTTDIEIVDIDLHSDRLSDVIEIAERWIRDLVEKEIEKVACAELGSLGTTFVQDLLKLADTTLQGYQVQSLGQEAIDPLYLEQTMDVPTDFVPLDLQDKESFVGGLLDQALQMLDDSLGSVVEDPNGALDTDLGVNVMLRSSFLDDDGALVLGVDQLGMDAVVFEGHDKLTESSILINQIKIFGLDTLTRFDPLDPIGKHTLQNKFTWKELILEFDVTVDIKPSSLDDAVLQDATSDGISERINVDFGVRDVDVEASVFIVADQDAVEAMELGSLLLIDNLLPCAMSIVHDLKVSELRVDPQNIDTPTLKGFVSAGLDKVITSAAEAAFDMYKGALENTIPNIFQTTVREFVNEQIMASFLKDSIESSACPEALATEDGFVDFRELFLSPEVAAEHQYGNLPSMLRGLLDTELLDFDTATGQPKINTALIDQVTSSQSGAAGSFVFDGNLLDTQTRVSVGGLDADLQLRASEAKIENLNTINPPLILLDTLEEEPFYLNNTATLGLPDRPLRFSSRLLFAVSGDDDNDIRNDMNVMLDLDSASIELLAMLKVAKSRFLGFPVSDIFDLNCWIATIPAPTLDDSGIRTSDSEITAALANIVMTVQKLNLNVSCIECSSPGIIEWAELLMTNEAQAGATQIANILLEAVSGILTGNFMQVNVDRMLVEAARKCPHDPSYDPDGQMPEYQPLEIPQSNSDISFLVLVGAVTAGLLAAISVLVLAVRCFVRRRHQNWLQSLPKAQIKVMKSQQKKEASIETEMNAKTSSIFSSPDVPRIVQWAMPLVILGNIGLFLSGHLSLGATVNIEANIAGQTLRVEEFFEFSMAKSTIDIWNAGGKELAILILIFSGIWPYTKQIITLGLWFAPPSWVSISKRGSILLWLDWLAKWSMIDIFVLVISIAAFRVSIQSPDVAFLPAGFYSVDLLVVPLWGLYANMLAQVVSQISSHFIIYYHRKICANAKHNLHQFDPACPDMQRAAMHRSKSSLSKHHFGRPHRGENEKLRVRSWVSYAIILIALFLVSFVITGCILPSFSLDVLGLIGVAVESGQEFEEATTYHSVFTVITLLMDQARLLGTTSDAIGLGTLSVLFLLTVLVVPILQTLTLLRQWFLPLNSEQRTRASVLMEILQAWQYAEVYLIAIFVASWQLGPISEFMINSYCESLSDFFSQMVYYGLLKEEDAQCFSVQSRIEEGAFILGAGAVLLALLSSLVTQAVTQYFRDTNQFDLGIPDELSNDVELKEDGKRTLDSIQPAPVLFTDTFRWLLKGSSKVSSSENAHGCQYNLQDKSILETMSSTGECIAVNERAMKSNSDEERGSIAKSDSLS